MKITSLPDEIKELLIKALINRATGKGVEITERLVKEFRKSLEDQVDAVISDVVRELTERLIITKSLEANEIRICFKEK